MKFRAYFSRFEGDLKNFVRNVKFDPKNNKIVNCRIYKIVESNTAHETQPHYNLIVMQSTTTRTMHAKHKSLRTVGGRRPSTGFLGIASTQHGTVCVVHQ